VALLLLALQAQESGQLDAAQELGRAAARDAEATGDVPTQAHALIFLAELGSALSRHREAHDTSQRAAFLCKTMGDVQGEAMALMLVGHTAGNLGRYEDAIEAALLSVKLLEELPLDPTTVMALTILGVVYMWGRNWDRAHQAFDSAVVAAGRCEPKVDVAYAVLNRALADILKHVYDRADQSGTSGDVEAQSALARRIERVIAGPPGRAPTPAGQRFFESLWQVCQTIVSIWLGHTQRVEQLMAATQEQLVRAPTALWLDFWHEWTKLELAWQRGDLAAAEHAAEQGFAVAVACENEQLACCALTTAGQLAELQGETARALTIQKRVRGRELSIRTEAMRRRERVVQWQLDMRHSEASLRALEVSSRTLERLSLEDPLTGIANRRSFERSVQVMLADRTHGGSPLCVALIDVDQFKRINDHH
jgi:tetratricopeptide (TPR) repeat protein